MWVQTEHGELINLDKMDSITVVKNSAQHRLVGLSKSGTVKKVIDYYETGKEARCARSWMGQYLTGQIDYAAWDAGRHDEEKRT